MIEAKIQGPRGWMRDKALLRTKLSRIKNTLKEDRRQQRSTAPQTLPVLFAPQTSRVVWRDGRGFTIVETLLFLAITALLLLIVTVGRGAQLRRTQFTDTLNSLHSKLTRVQSEINSTTNNNPGATGTDTDKIEFMAEVVFTPDSDIVSIRSCQANSIDPQLPLPLVTFPCTEVSTYQMKWGAKWDSSCLPAPATLTTDLAQGIMLLRDHRNGSLKTIPYSNIPLDTNSDAMTAKFNLVDNAKIPIRNGYGDRCGYIDINENTSLNQLNKVFL